MLPFIAGFNGLGRTGRLRDKSRPGRSAEAVSTKMVAGVEVFINKDRTVTLQEAANQYSVKRHTSDFTRKKNV